MDVEIKKDTSLEFDRINKIHVLSLDTKKSCKQLMRTGFFIFNLVGMRGFEPPTPDTP